ncbi:MAG: hypothetical protein ACE5E5_13630 [Phycisphaerae bacterium]
MMTQRSVVALLMWVVAVVFAGRAAAAPPDHPIITEVYTDPVGLTDGPVARDAASTHQEFIEIYLPTLADLALSLNPDALNLTFYEVEGDLISSGVNLVNYRFDLPTFDLNPANGMTGLARPPSGVVVLGWVDYFGNPPVDLAGTPSTRIGLVNGGITTPPADYLFLPINGNQFTGTTNFTPVVAESLIDLPSEATSGVVQNGSGAYLLVNRDSPGYVELCDDAHALDCLPAGAHPHLDNDALGLSTTALMDGFAANDHTKFRVLRQPYSPGDGVDLESTLPAGGAFTPLVPQVPESSGVQPAPGKANGYARVFVDVAKTTENATPADDDPVADALGAYRHVRNDGPFFPTPGRASSTTSAPELGVALAPEQVFNVLPLTVGRPGVLSANLGGSFGIDLVATVGVSSDPTVATFVNDVAATGVVGQAFGFPRIAVTPASSLDGLMATASVTVTASNTAVGDPAVVNAVQTTTITARILNPTTGTDENGLPRQATVFAAVQGIPAQVGVANEFLTTDLGAYAAANLGFAVQAGRGHGAMLADPLTDLNDGFFVQNVLIEDFPDPLLPFTFINAPAAGAGLLDLLDTVLLSAEVASGSGAYDETVNTTQTGLRALRLNHPDILTFGGTFTPSERLHFVEPTGRVGEPRSGLSFATTTRTFELAIVDANVRNNNTLETGATDDFGIVVEVLDVEAGAPAAPGEYVFLSFSGGLQGMDIDSLDVPGGPNVASIIFLDLDNLHDVLGIRTIEQIYAIDSNGTGELDPIDVYSLNPVFIPECITNIHCDDANACTTDTCDVVLGVCQHTTLADGAACGDALFCNGTETCQAGVCISSGAPCPGGCEQCDEVADVCTHCPFDLDNDGFDVIGTGDFGLFSGCFGRSYLPSDTEYVACMASNFDGDMDPATGAYVVGTGDFGVFSGCFGQTCGACATCFP